MASFVITPTLAFQKNAIFNSDTTRKQRQPQALYKHVGIH